jgi:hypothetical protein
MLCNVAGAVRSQSLVNFNKIHLGSFSSTTALKSFLDSFEPFKSVLNHMWEGYAPGRCSTEAHHSPATSLHDFYCGVLCCSRCLDSFAKLQQEDPSENLASK